MTNLQESGFNPLDTPEGRQRIWATIYVQALKGLKLRTAWRALKLARMDNPPREWPKGWQP